MKPENTSSRRFSIYCRICGKELSVPIVILHGLVPTILLHSLVFCKEHKRQFARRRREGVSTVQLNTAWRDLLDNWRERPEELDQETRKRKKASRLFFSQRYENWLLFRRDYPRFLTPREVFRGIGSLLTLGKIKPYKASAVLRTKKGRRSRSAPRLVRLGDSLAFNTQTGEIRRFIDVMEDEVLDDLRGIRPAPGQAEVAAFWGNSAPTGMRERLRERFQQQVAPGYRLLISELVRLAPFSVYGPIGNPLDLVLKGGGWEGGGSDEIGGISLSFSSPRFASTERHFEIITAKANRRNVYYPLEDDEQHSRDLDEWLFQWTHLSDKQREQVGPPAIWRGELLIDEETFSGEIRAWSQPYQLARFSFKNDKIILSGHACGPTQGELLHLLTDLKRLNQRGDTLGQYQCEFDEERARRINSIA